MAHCSPLLIRQYHHCSNNIFKRLNITTPLPPWKLGTHIKDWADLAPGPLDNFLVRSLLGRHVHCTDMDFSKGSVFNRSSAAHAAARIMAMDGVLTLDEVGAFGAIGF
jgi:hypothetical protein